MNSRAEFEQEADGRRIAGIPDLPGVPAHGSGRDEALAYVQALARTGWTIKREIGPRMLARIAKHTGLTPKDLQLPF